MGSFLGFKHLLGVCFQGDSRICPICGTYECVWNNGDDDGSRISLEGIPYFVAKGGEWEKLGIKWLKEGAESGLSEYLLREARKKIVDNPIQRYRVEYEEGLYRAYKPGIDDRGIGHFVPKIEKLGIAVEIGAGPAYILERTFIYNGSRSSQLLDIKKIAVDLVLHPNLRKGIEGIEGDICDPGTVRKVLERVGDYHGRRALVALSYCLDRVADQYAALANFAALVKELGARGLITVCLPAQPESPGIEGMSYADPAKWLTKGKTAEEDFQLIAEQCHKEGLKPIMTGYTTHYGFSLDGWEELPCYILVVKPI